MDLIHIHHSGANDLGDVVVSRQHDLVNLALFLREFATHGVGTCVVRDVVHQVLATAIDQQQTTIFEHTLRVEIVQRLAVLRHDRRERHAQAHRLGNALDLARNFALDKTLTTHLHCGRMHLITNQKSILQLLNLLVALHFAHLCYGEHQIDRFMLVQHIDTQAEQRRDQHLRLATIGGQIVHTSIQRNCLTHRGRKLRKGCSLGYTHLRTKLSHSGLRTCPDDIFDRKIIAIECRFTRLGIDDTHHRGHIQSEKVEERRILTEIVSIVGIVVRRGHITREQNHSLADSAAELCATCRVCVCAEHSCGSL